MKLRTLFESDDGTLIGKEIKGIIVEPDMKIWGGDFSCSECNLTSLKGCPEEIKGDFSCSRNQNLTSLEFGPNIVNGDYRCINCDLTSLKGCPEEINGIFDCSFNKNLTSIEFGPKIVNGDYRCNCCNLTSLHNIHKYTQQISNKFFCGGNTIKSHMLGLLLIKDLKEVACYKDDIMYEPAQIINKYLKQPMSKQRMFDCQEELIQAGFKEYAQL